MFRLGRSALWRNQLVAMLVGALLAQALGLRVAATIAPFGAVLAAAILWLSPARELLVLPSASRGDR